MKHFSDGSDVIFDALHLVPHGVKSLFIFVVEVGDLVLHFFVFFEYQSFDGFDKAEPFIIVLLLKVTDFLLEVSRIGFCKYHVLYTFELFDRRHNLVVLQVDLGLVGIVVNILQADDSFVGLGDDCDQEVEQDDDHQERVEDPHGPR